jgi:hypothetical protein
MEEESDFNIEEEYEKLRKKYDLPEYEKLIEDFEVEKIGEKETEFVAREIRRTINEKIAAYIHLFETLINPTSPPMFVFRILKNMTEKEKEKMQEIYKDLSKTQIEIMKLDTIYKESEEAKFISKTFILWQKTKPEAYKIFESFEKNFENGNKSKGRSYFD